MYLTEDLRKEKSKKFFETIKEDFLQSKRNKNNIKITTFLTKKAFTEVFISKWIENPVRTIYQSPKWREPKELSFPFFYSNDEINDGRYLLSQISVCKLKEILSSELFTFDTEVLKRYQERLASFSMYLNEKQFWVNNNPKNIRISKKFHEPYIKAIYGIERFIEEKQYCILFQESCHHEYDDYSNSRRIESHYSYLIFDIDEKHIRLKPMNSKYSSYTFYLSSSADTMVAAYFLIVYFTSFDTNKRQRLAIDKLWRHFGITSYSK